MPRAGRQSGFSLIEALAALAIMALIVTVTTPNLARGLDAISFETKSKRYLNEIDLIRIRAFVDKRHIVFPDAEPSEHTPILSEGLEGWSLSGGPLVFLKTGACLGGDITLHAPSGRSATYDFSEPDCAPTRRQL